MVDGEPLIECSECGREFAPDYIHPEDFGFYPEPNDRCELCLAGAAAEWAYQERQYVTAQGGR